MSATCRKPLEAPPQGHVHQRRAVHLFRYLDEQAFRFNNRKASDGERFVEALSSVVGKRLTYQELIRNIDKQLPLL